MQDFLVWLKEEQHCFTNFNSQTQKSIAVLIDLAEDGLAKLASSQVSLADEVKKLVEEIVSSFGNWEVRVKHANYLLCCQENEVRGFETDVVIGELRRGPCPSEIAGRHTVGSQFVPVPKPVFISHAKVLAIMLTTQEEADRGVTGYLESGRLPDSDLLRT
jgi:hypothetical protein